jgi:CubicO group peptidase (beta-lactamase class C family)
MKVFIGGTEEQPQYGKCQKDMTIKQLLLHTAGLGYGFAGMEKINPMEGVYQKADVTNDGMGVSKRLDWSLAELCDVLATLPLNFEPGTKWNYSASTDVVARIIEVISGQSFPDFLQSRVFEPLGMVDTSHVVEGAKRDRFATCMIEKAKGHQIDAKDHEEQSGSYSSKMRMMSGGSGMTTTMPDYLQFTQCLLSGGVAPNGTRLLSRKTVQFMTTNHLVNGSDMAALALPHFTAIALPGMGYGPSGCSIALEPDDRTNGVGLSKGTFAWGGLGNTAFWCDPQEDLVVIFMTQVLGLDRTRLPIRPLVANVVTSAIVDGNLLTGKL